MPGWTADPCEWFVNVAWLVLVRGAVTEAEIEPLPVKPKRLEFNPGEAVLAKVRQVRLK